MNFTKINRWWPLFVGGVLAPVVLTILVALLVKGDIAFYTWLLWLHLPLLNFHEFEEYVLPGGFKRFINIDTPLASTPPSEDVPLNDPYEFAVNSFFWVLIIVGALLATVAPWVGLTAVVLQLLINNFTHTLAFQTKHRGYNPGLITTIFVLMPYCTLVITYIVMENLFTTTDWVLGIGVALVVIVTMLTISLTRRKRATSAAGAVNA